MTDTRKIEVGYRVRRIKQKPGDPWAWYGRAKKSKSGWFVPKKGNGPLAVFATYNDAVRFVAGNGHPTRSIAIDRVYFVRSEVQTMQWTVHANGWFPVSGPYWNVNGALCLVKLADSMPKGKTLVDAFYIAETEVDE